MENEKAVTGQVATEVKPRSSRTLSRASRKALRGRELLALFEKLEHIASISPRERETQLTQALHLSLEDGQVQISQRSSKSVDRKDQTLY